MSISAHSLSSPLYLCEVEVLTPVAGQVDIHQCKRNLVSGDGVIVYNNMCVFLNIEGRKMTFKEGSKFCQEKGFSLLNKQTEKDAAVYDFVK